jgi:hypothetical protein
VAVMTAGPLSRTPRAELLRAMCGAELGVGLDRLDGLLREYAECPLQKWSRDFSRRPRAGTLVAATLMAGGLRGLSTPRLATQRYRSVCHSELVEAARARFGAHVVVDEIVGQITTVVGWPADLSAVLEVLELADHDAGWQTRRSLIEVLLDDEETLLVEGEDHGAVGLARQVLEEDDSERPSLDGRLADRLAAPAQRPHLPAWLARLCELAERSGAAPSAPIGLVARLPEPIGLLASLLPELLGRRPARWQAIRPVFSHLERLGEVLRLVDPPTLSPRPSARGRIHLDEQAALAYDRALEDEVAALADEEELSIARAAKRLMRGFGLFRAVLECASDRGIHIEALPVGVSARGSLQRYQGLRPDLTPSAETYRTYLAWLPALLAGEEQSLARLAILDAVTPLRPHAVLSLDQRGWVDEEEGTVVYVRGAARHKVGRAAVFLPAHVRDVYRIGRHWLPEETPPVPPPVVVSAYDQLAERVRQRLAQKTGISLPGGHYAARRGLVQLLRSRLAYPDIQAITAYLDHASPTSRSSYLRVVAGETSSARSRLAGGRRG